MHDYQKVSAEDSFAAADLMCEVYRQLFNVPDEIDVNWNVYISARNELTIKIRTADIEFEWDDDNG